jgi:putative molybdopterin biosynthesis protein
VPCEQEQFLQVVDRDTAERLWHAMVQPGVLGSERVPLGEALGRVLAADVSSAVDVPAFDRSNVDGYAVRALDTFDASEIAPRELHVLDEELATGVVPVAMVAAGSAQPIATGAVVPRGADAVVMVEHAVIGHDRRLFVRKPVAPGSGITFAGTDVALGELVLRKGTRLSSRETGILAAIGRDTIDVVRKPHVAVISTGDEIIPPGTSQRTGTVYDANSTLLADAVRELGGEPVVLGIVGDDEEALQAVLDRALRCSDLVLLSGGTSKGAGDLSYRMLASRAPGVVVHGVALKPGKPICLGAVEKTPIAILPGFPTSAIFTFHEFVAPIVRVMGGLRHTTRETLPARLPNRFNSEVGRTEYLLVNLVTGPQGLTAYPMGKGSGSVTTFGRADGFIIIPRDREFVDVGETVQVVAFGGGATPADLVVIGSHCVGLDVLLGFLGARGFSSKTLWVGSQGGLAAAERGECDLAGIHLLDAESNVYNLPFLPAGVRLLRGYGRLQGLVFRRNDERFSGGSVEEAVTRALEDSACLLVNRNRGSGTRVLIDGLLRGRRPPGYAVEARSHNAVAAAVAQERADWGMAIAQVADSYGLGFLPLQAERFDFAVPERSWHRPAVSAFRDVLTRSDVRGELARLGFVIVESIESCQ